MVAAARDMASEEAPFTVATGYATEILYEGVALNTTPAAAETPIFGRSVAVVVAP